MNKTTDNPTDTVMKAIVINHTLHKRAKRYAKRHGLKLYALAERAIEAYITDEVTP